MSSTESKLPPHPVLTDYYDDESGRKEKVKELFDTTAGHYDWINKVMSFGTGENYRLEALERAGLAKGQRVLDIGCGTGVLARHEIDMVGPEGFVLGVDPSQGMLREAVNRGVGSVAMGRGEKLPLTEQQFDVVTMGFALRHVADLKEAFTEYLRVLKPGGKVLLLEIAPPTSRIGYHAVKFYMKRVIPFITRLGTKDKNAQLLMTYYWDTVEQCVPPAGIIEALKEAGFEQVERKVLYGVFGEYSAKRPE